MSEITETKRKHLRDRRMWVFLDEWLTYVLLYKVYTNEKTRWLTLPVGILGLVFNMEGYKNLDELRKKYDVIE